MVATRNEVNITLDFSIEFLLAARIDNLLKSYYASHPRKTECDVCKVKSAIETGGLTHDIRLNNEPC